MARKKKERKESKDEDRSGLFVPAGIFLGIGFGFVFDHVAAGLFVGLGAGFLGMALVKMFYRK